MRSSNPLTFYDAFYGGVLVLKNPGSQTIVLSQTGYPSDTLFTGATSSPTIKLGTYSLAHDGGAQFTNNLSVAITNLTPPSPPATTVTPKPSSLLLLATGLVSGAGTCIRRFRAS